jgi:hypothetical protein
MARWVGLAADWLTPVYDAIRKAVFDKGYAKLDETPIRHLDLCRMNTEQLRQYVSIRLNGRHESVLL